MMSDKKQPWALTEGDTPWVHEPDYWSKSIGDYHLIAMRNTLHGGFWTGYVGVPREAKIDRHALRVHGYVTFDGSLLDAGGRLGYRYLGFECNAYGDSTVDGYDDCSPRDYRKARHDRLVHARYRPLSFVETELLALVEQLRLQRSVWTRLKRWWHHWRFRL